VCACRGGDFNGTLNNPLFFGGVFYFTTVFSTWAAPPATGFIWWRHDWKPKSKEANGSIKNRGVAIKDGRLVRGAQDGWMFALDAQTGRLLWEVKAADAEKYEALSINPLLFEDLVIIGPSGSEFGIKGWIGAFRLEDGQPVWKFDTIPGDGAPGAETWGDADSRLKGGGGIWTTPALDVANGRLYVAVGNPAPDLFANQRPGTNLYTSSLVVLDVRTGALLWHKQVVPHDTHDWDMPVSAPLFTAAIGGAPRHVVTLGAKDGLLRLVDRDNREEFYSVPVTTRSNADVEPTEEGVHTCPGLLGGVEWSIPAYSPKLDMMIVPAVDWCGVFRKDDEARFVAGQLFLGGSFTYDPVEKSTGWLTALRATTGQELWKYHSSRPMLAAVTVTSGDMLFTGELSGDFLAMDARNGQVVYRYNGGGSIIGGVISYAVAGKQYVAVVSGMAGAYWLSPAGATTVTVFALP
jgi:alcohol dehydrogenase (cytochrome c)